MGKETLDVKAFVVLKGVFDVAVDSSAITILVFNRHSELLHNVRRFPLFRQQPLRNPPRIVYQLLVMRLRQQEHRLNLQSQPDSSQLLRQLPNPPRHI